MNVLAMEDKVDFRISWYLGFGWVSIVTVVMTGIGINLLHPPVSWLLYLPFLVVAIYMTVRFRLFTTHPWRRIHARAMLRFGQFAEKEYQTASQEGRAYDIRVPCRELLVVMFGPENDEAARLLTDAGRRGYYRELVRDFPEIFLKSFAAADPETVFAKINEDIESSELGPDILIARDIELKYSRKEAATYLQSLMLGTVR